MSGTFRIGCHISAAGGYLAMGRRAAALGADTFAFFTRNPRGGAAKKPDADDAAAFRAFCTERNIGAIVAHAPYTLNPCAAEPRVLEFARLALEEDLQRMESFTPGQLYNLHPGSHVGQGAEVGIEKLSALLNELLRPDMTTTVLLETMAGKGSEIGGSFAQLAEVFSRVHCSDRLGVCLDTCHVWDGGYDIVGNLEGVLEEFDRVVGLPRLRAIHLNDSLNPCGARKDRHARLGEGCIGLPAFTAIIRHPALQRLPFVLETPNDEDGYAREIAWVRAVHAGDDPAPPHRQ